MNRLAVEIPEMKLALDERPHGKSNIVEKVYDAIVKHANMSEV